MRKLLVVGLAAVLGLFCAVPGAAPAVAADPADKMVIHNVFFTLKESSPEARQKLVDACKKYLTKHDGEVYFAAGARADEFKREINDKDFDVSLTIVFKDREAHDKYQEAKRHKEFIAENKDSWAKVRVFDSLADKTGEKAGE